MIGPAPDRPEPAADLIGFLSIAQSARGAHQADERRRAFRRSRQRLLERGARLARLADGQQDLSEQLVRRLLNEWRTELERQLLLRSGRDAQRLRRLASLALRGLDYG